MLVIVLVIFGPKRLPELARSVGKASREFKSAIREDPDKEASERAATTQASEIPPGEDAGPTVTATPVSDDGQKQTPGG